MKSLLVRFTVPFYKWFTSCKFYIVFDWQGIAWKGIGQERYKQE